MTVGDLIESRTTFYSIADDLTVHEAARYLREKQVRSVGVCDRHGKLVRVVRKVIFPTRWPQRTSALPGCACRKS